jgi:hypothetical protein
MRPSAVNVYARWDEEAKVWHAHSNDVAGLAIEAATVEELGKRLLELVPELIGINHPDWLKSAEDMPVHVMAEMSSRIPLGHA